jgi:hypothetical protein
VVLCHADELRMGTLELAATRSMAAAGLRAAAKQTASSQTRHKLLQFGRLM